ncbi:MAG: hypothetical protein GYB55_16560 [Cytophagales bacterium]|uniref:hypothetical protein n=1 Tax=Cyclobacterium marinum TaxID=104 RepID=UPI0030DB8B40|nr:hypothetical protein [Cytophagales bacterium]|tara:strand:+ start:40272 stop:41192 length:921 start_codon:yes stop_codon:yes gene_type:complete
MPKRSSISEERLIQLTQKNARYIISCNQNEFFCEHHPEGKCSRGFFSLFLQVIYGIAFAKKYGLPHYVDFSNVNYAYSGQQNDQKRGNFWEHFFDQIAINSTDTLLLNHQYEVYPLRIWNRKHHRFLHQIMKEGLKFKPSLKLEIDNIKCEIAHEKVLGVHFRKTDHFMEVAPADESVFFQKIKKNFSAYDKIFIATDDQQLLERLKNEFSPKIIAHDFVRSHGEIPIHNNEAYKDGLRLAKEALLDCISLSYCKELILSPSNLSYAALVFNPEVKYTIVESKEARLSRIKTLMGYHLDKLGIRKW